tara:strand:- start:874 stop:1353 length:480 start_codon:yes stop_codon:yes gene_type:complete
MANYDLLHSTTLTVGSSNTLTISPIAGTYRDLILVTYLQGSNSNRINGNLNSDTGTNYSQVSAQNDGGSSSSDSATSNAYFHAGVCTNNTWAVNTVQLMDYSSNDKHTVMLSHENAGTSRSGIRAMRWANNAPVTSITISTTAGTFDAGCTFKLFGIEA